MDTNEVVPATPTSPELPKPHSKVSNLNFSVQKQSGLMFLIAKFDLQADIQTFVVSGYFPSGCFGKTGIWNKKSKAQQDVVLTKAITEYHKQLGDPFQYTIAAINSYFKTCVSEGFELSIEKVIKLLHQGSDLVKLKGKLHDILNVTRTKHHQLVIATKIGTEVNLTAYPESFPVFKRERKIIAVLGPTNSGKTYDALQRLSIAESGIYLGPLRLLALEAYSKLNNELGIPTSLVTGEERRIVPNSRVTASTIEMLNPEQEVEVCIIDEIQMLDDADRGWAWTQGVVGANASEIWVLGALSSEAAIRSLGKRLGLPVEVQYKKRKHPLVVSKGPLDNNPMSAIKNCMPGDAFIVFSRKDALSLRDDLLGLKKTVACVYGALSPEVREREATRFASGEADILVATDAIGMGLNLPIKRIIFTSIQKYNGYCRIELPTALVQQIAGRAGRYGHQEEDGIVSGLTKSEHSYIKAAMKEKQETIPVSGFGITASLNYLESISKITGEKKLESLLYLFKKHADCGDHFFVPHIQEDQLLRAGILDQLKSMSLPMKLAFSMTPMTTDEGRAMRFWHNWAIAASQGKTVKISFTNSPKNASLAEAEESVKILNGYRWLGLRYPEIFIDYTESEDLLFDWTEAVDQQLKGKKKQGVSSFRGGPSWYWVPRESYY